VLSEFEVEFKSVSEVEVVATEVTVEGSDVESVVVVERSDVESVVVVEEDSMVEVESIEVSLVDSAFAEDSIEDEDSIDVGTEVSDGTCSDFVSVTDSIVVGAEGVDWIEVESEGGGCDSEFVSACVVFVSGVLFMFVSVLLVVEDGVSEVEEGVSEEVFDGFVVEESLLSEDKEAETSELVVVEAPVVSEDKVVGT